MFLLNGIYVSFIELQKYFRQINNFVNLLLHLFITFITSYLFRINRFFKVSTTVDVKSQDKKHQKGFIIKFINS